MNIDPTLLAGGTIVATIAAAGAYAYFTGNEASVDVDDDGVDEVTFGGEPSTPATPPVSEEKSFVAEEETVEKAPADPTPDAVAEIGENLVGITGIGPTRADRFREAGYITGEDIYYASDANLTDVNGIGNYTVEQIRDDIGGIDAEAGNDTSSDSEDEAETSESGEDESSDTALDAESADSGANSSDDESDTSEDETESGSGSSSE